MNAAAILRAIMYAALLGVAVLVLMGILSRVAGKASGAVRAAV